MPDVPSYFFVSPDLLGQQDRHQGGRRRNFGAAPVAQPQPQQQSRRGLDTAVGLPIVAKAPGALPAAAATPASALDAPAPAAAVPTCRRFPTQPGSLQVCHAAVSHDKSGRVKLGSRVPILRPPEREAPARSKTAFGTIDKVAADQGTESQLKLKPPIILYKQPEQRRNMNIPFYCFGGAAVAGKKESTYRKMSMQWPGGMFGVELIGFVMHSAMPNTKTLLMTGLFPRLLARAPAEDTIVGGLSLGGWPAYETAYLADTAMRGMRMIVVMDDRRRHPDPFDRAGMSMAANTKITDDDNFYFKYVNRQFAKGWNQSYVALCLQQTCRRTRALSRELLFCAPVKRGEGADAVTQGATALFRDERFYPRLGLYAEQWERIFLPDTDHFTITFDHAWDICKRVRAAADVTTSPNTCFSTFRHNQHFGCEHERDLVLGPGCTRGWLPPSKKVKSVQAEAPLKSFLAAMSGGW